jgi:hypothetical protein
MSDQARVHPPTGGDLEVARGSLGSTTWRMTCSQALEMPGILLYDVVMEGRRYGPQLSTHD